MASSRKFEWSELIRVPIGALLLWWLVPRLYRTVRSLPGAEGLDIVQKIADIGFSLLFIAIGAVMAFGWLTEFCLAPVGNGEGLV